MGGVNGKPNNASSAEEARRGQSIPKALRGRWPPPSSKRGCKRVSCIDATTERHISKVQRHLSRMHAKRRAEAVQQRRPADPFAHGRVYESVFVWDTVQGEWPMAADEVCTLEMRGDFTMELVPPAGDGLDFWLGSGKLQFEPGRLSKGGLDWSRLSPVDGGILLGCKTWDQLNELCDEVDLDYLAGWGGTPTAELLKQRISHSGDRWERAAACWASRPLGPSEGVFLLQLAQRKENGLFALILFRRRSAFSGPALGPSAAARAAAHGAPDASAGLNVHLAKVSHELSARRVDRPVDPFKRGLVYTAVYEWNTEGGNSALKAAEAPRLDMQGRRRMDLVPPKAWKGRANWLGSGRLKFDPRRLNTDGDQWSRLVPVDGGVLLGCTSWEELNDRYDEARDPPSLPAATRRARAHARCALRQVDLMYFPGLGASTAELYVKQHVCGFYGEAEWDKAAASICRRPFGPGEGVLLLEYAQYCEGRGAMLFRALAEK